jgi:hypothetical protein
MAAEKKEEYKLLLGEPDNAGYTEEKERVMTFAEAAEKRGTQKGEHKTLIRLLDKKFGLKKDEKDLIRRIEDLEKIEAAIDEILDTERKEQVLAQLK